MRLTVQWQDRSREPHAGQFYMLRAWAADATPILSRPISVDDFDNQTGALTFLYQVKGEGTHKLAALKKELKQIRPCPLLASSLQKTGRSRKFLKANIHNYVRLFVSLTSS